MEFRRCEHPQGARRLLHEDAFQGSVAREPRTVENPAAHGGVRHTVECTGCGGRRTENVNQHHVEVSPWRDVRREQRAADEAARTAAARARVLVGQIRNAYGQKGDIIEDSDGVVLIRRTWSRKLRDDGLPDIVIGTSLDDAARRSQHPKEAATIRQATA